MIHKIKRYTLTLLTILTVAVPIGLPVMVANATTDCSSNIANNVGTGANYASGGSSAGTGSSAINCSSSSVDDGSIGKLANEVVKLFSIIVGAISVIMIIYGGLRYITSGGDSGRVGSAKNTLIYAVLGLLIVALAQLIVHFVLNQSNNINNGS
jgi:hypothetical protein